MGCERIGKLQRDDRPLVISHFTSNGDNAFDFGASENQGYVI